MISLSRMSLDSYSTLQSHPPSRDLERLLVQQPHFNVNLLSQAWYLALLCISSNTTTSSVIHNVAHRPDLKGEYPPHIPPLAHTCCCLPKVLVPRASQRRKRPLTFDYHAHSHYVFVKPSLHTTADVEPYHSSRSRRWGFRQSCRLLLWFEGDEYTVSLAAENPEVDDVRKR